MKKKTILYSSLVLSLVLLPYACKSETKEPATVSSGSGTPYTPPTTSDLIISEISVVTRADIPETGNNRNTYIELYNGTDADVDLSNYVMLYSKNAQDFGVDPGDTLFLSGTLASKECFLIIRDGITSASTLNTALADEVWLNLKANGDDGIALAKTDGAGGWNMIDVFGEAAQPLSDWDICGTTGGSADQVLRRKQSVTGPTTDWSISQGSSASDCQWDQYALGAYLNVKEPTGKP